MALNVILQVILLQTKKIKENIKDDKHNGVSLNLIQIISKLDLIKQMTSVTMRSMLKHGILQQKKKERVDTSKDKQIMELHMQVKVFRVAFFMSPSQNSMSIVAQSTWFSFSSTWLSFHQEKGPVILGILPPRSSC
jgi:hypothetical protein